MAHMMREPAGALEELEVRHIHPYQAVKPYRCPGCDHEIPPGQGHEVVVPRDDWRLRDEPSLRPVATDPLLARLAELDPGHTETWLASRRAPAPALRETVDAMLAALGSTDSGSPILRA